MMGTMFQPNGSTIECDTCVARTRRPAATASSATCSPTMPGRSSTSRRTSGRTTSASTRSGRAVRPSRARRRSGGLRHVAGVRSWCGRLAAASEPGGSTMIRRWAGRTAGRTLGRAPPRAAADDRPDPCAVARAFGIDHVGVARRPTCLCDARDAIHDRIDGGLARRHGLHVPQSGTFDRPDTGGPEHARRSSSPPGRT